MNLHSSTSLNNPSHNTFDSGVQLLFQTRTRIIHPFRIDNEKKIEKEQQYPIHAELYVGIALIQGKHKEMVYEVYFKWSRS